MFMQWNMNIAYDSKKKILKRILELAEHKMGRDVIQTLKDDCGKAIFEACAYNSIV